MDEPILVIQEQVGVCGVREDTRTLAELAARGRPGRALDMGTGTGYVAIYLARKGWQVDATDVSVRALDLAQHNAKANQAEINFIASDLFEDLVGVYDLIAFNPPMRADETELTRLFTSILRGIGWLSRALMHATHGRLATRRLPFLYAFMQAAQPHLRAGSRLLLVIEEEEARAVAAQFDWVSPEPFVSFQTIPYMGIAPFTVR